MSLKQVSRIVAVGVASAVVMPTPSFAQNATQGANPGLEAGAAICMVRERPDNANVEASERGKLYHVVVAAEDQDRFAKRGFIAVPCEESERTEQEAKELYRDEACELAAFGNTAVQRQLAKSIGESPSALCASAQKAMGKWKGKKRTRPQEEPKADQTQQSGSGE